MIDLLKDFVIKEILSVYLDDIIIFSAELEDYVIDVLAVIERLQEKSWRHHSKSHSWSQNKSNSSAKKSKDVKSEPTQNEQSS